MKMQQQSVYSWLRHATTVLPCREMSRERHKKNMCETICTHKHKGRTHRVSLNPNIQKGRIPNRASSAGTMWMHYCLPHQNQTINNGCYKSMPKVLLYGGHTNDETMSRTEIQIRVTQVSSWIHWIHHRWESCCAKSELTYTKKCAPCEFTVA
jgi:NADH:ubiquinone oxidoreductase subunit